jgi:hypothetical protein
MHRQAELLHQPQGNQVGPALLVQRDPGRVVDPPSSVRRRPDRQIDFCQQHRVVGRRERAPQAFQLGGPHAERGAKEVGGVRDVNSNRLGR